MAYIRALMDREGIPDFAELDRLTGVSQTQFTNWKSGKNQPMMDTLDRLAPALRTTKTALYIAAGRLSPGHLDAPGEVNMAVLPREILDLVELYSAASTDVDRATIREQTAFLIRGLRTVIGADVSTAKAQRRRTG